MSSSITKLKSVAEPEKVGALFDALNEDPSLVSIHVEGQKYIGITRITLCQGGKTKLVLDGTFRVLVQNDEEGETK